VNTRETAEQLLKYAVVGLFSSLMTYGIFLTLYRLGGVHHLTASGIGYGTGVLASFLVNKEWTFRAKGSGETMCVRFALMHGVSMGFNVGSLQFLSTSIGLAPELGQVVALGCSGPLDFFGNKFWTFKAERVVKDLADDIA
jgi:putative flippase GtrA